MNCPKTIRRYLITQLANDTQGAMFEPRSKNFYNWMDSTSINHTKTNFLSAVIKFTSNLNYPKSTTFITREL